MKRIAAAVVAALVVSGCGNGAKQSAQAAYDECGEGLDVVRLDGSVVRIEVTGSAARSMAQGIDPDSDLDDMDMSGATAVLGTFLALECLIEHTDYPGTSNELRSGDEWGNWRFEEGEVVGSEVRLAFVARG